MTLMPRARTWLSLYNLKIDIESVADSCSAKMSDVSASGIFVVLYGQETKKTSYIMQKGKIGVTTENIFPVIKQFLYSDREIFLREIVSNAVDATQKLRTLASKGDFKGKNQPF